VFCEAVSCKVISSELISREFKLGESQFSVYFVSLTPFFDNFGCLLSAEQSFLDRRLFSSGCLFSFMSVVPDSIFVFCKFDLRL